MEIDMDNCPFYPYNMHVSFSIMKLFIQISEEKKEKKRKRLGIAEWRFKGGNAETGQLETAKTGIFRGLYFEGANCAVKSELNFLILWVRSY